MAAPRTRRPGLALRHDRIALGLHHGADERRPEHRSRPAYRPGAFRAADEPSGCGALAAGARDARTRRGALEVTVRLALVAFAALGGFPGAALLGRARWTAKAPLLGIVTYLGAVWSVIPAVTLAGLTLALHTSALGGGLSHLIGACVIRLRNE